jgi:hypothetical protein
MQKAFSSHCFSALALVGLSVVCSAQNRPVPALPSLTAEQKTLFQEANRFRRIMGLPPFTLNPKLCAAAQAHCRYSFHNPGESHWETEGNLGFKGCLPSDRATAFGYESGVSEGMNFGGTAQDAVAGLMEAPYHRVPFMQPGSPEFGGGFHFGVTTLNFSTTEGKSWAVYPGMDQRDVPLQFTGNEVPNPLRLHGVPAPVGYVVSLLVFGETENVTILFASMCDAKGKIVPCYVNTPQNDDRLPNGVFLIPHKPLLPFTQYTASVTFRRSDGQETAVTWSFTTRKAAQKAGSISLRSAAKPTSGQTKKSAARRTKPSSRN